MMRRYPLKILGLILCAGMGLGLCVASLDVSAQDNAIRSSSGGTLDLSSSGLNPAPDNLQRFDFEVVDTGALELARKVYAGYAKSIGIKPDFSMPDYARYIPLMPSQNKRFLGYYTKGEIGGVCPRLGCETQVFENFAKNKWRIVMNVFAHDIWIDPRSGSNKTPRDIYIFSAYSPPESPDFSSNPDVQQLGSFEVLSKQSWDIQKNKYVFEGKYYMTDYPRIEQ